MNQPSMLTPSLAQRANDAKSIPCYDTAPVWSGVLVACGVGWKPGGLTKVDLPPGRHQCRRWRQMG